MNNLVEHLDTLVGLRSPKHQCLYENILKAVMSLEIGDTLVDGILKITRDYCDNNSIRYNYYYIDYNNRYLEFWNPNISSNMPNKKNMYFSLDEVCRHILGICFKVQEPWEVN